MALYYRSLSSCTKVYRPVLCDSSDPYLEQGGEGCNIFRKKYFVTLAPLDRTEISGKPSEMVLVVLSVGLVTDWSWPGFDFES